LREERYLVIRRAAGIAAPGKYCFPGGGIEPGETEDEALRRELREELAAEVQPLRCIWRSVTSWGVSLSWWFSTLVDETVIVPNPAEVASVHWLSRDEMLALAELLVDRDHVDQSQVDDVDEQFGIDDLFECFANGIFADGHGRWLLLTGISQMDQ